MIKMLVFDVKKSEKQFLDNFDTSDFDITLSEEALNENTKLTVKECDETVILSIFLTSKVTEKVLNKFKNLRIIATRSICYNHIDIKACAKRNIAVINAENYGRNSVSQFVMALIFALTRNIVCAAFDIKNNIFNFEKYESEDIDKLSLGVIGTGNIGSAVCELANKLGMKIYANDIIINKNINDFVEYVSLNDLLRKSDIITLHLPYINEFHHLISEKELSIMKKDSYIINTSNYKLLDTVALYKALNNKQLKGAALDIIWDEKTNIFDDDCEEKNYEKLEDILVRKKLLSLENVIITPRIAYDTKESLKKIMLSNFHDIKDFYIGRKTHRII